MPDFADNPIPSASRIVRTLARHDVEFVVCGGVACLLQGVERVTTDIDLCVRLEDSNLRRFIVAARELSLTPRIPESLEAITDPSRRKAWIEQKHAVVCTFSSPHLILQVDVLLTYPISFDELAARADRKNDGGVAFLVSSRQHLIAAKEQVNPQRDIDRRDIEDLRRLLNRDQPG